MRPEKRGQEPDDDGCKWIGESFETKDSKIFYSAVELEPFEGEGNSNFEVRVGQYVEVIPDTEDNCIGGVPFLPNGEERVFVLEVQELFEAKRGKFCRGAWYYTIFDTSLKVSSNGKLKLPMEESAYADYDTREVFFVDDEEDYNSIISLNSIKRVVTFQFVAPGERCWRPDRNIQYWCRMSHSYVHLTFRDHTRTKVKEKCLEREKNERVLRALDLYCGCGGLSFTGSNEFQTTGARVEVAYAVDAWPDATATFKLNHPQTKVFIEGVEDFLIKCKAVHALFHDVCDQIQHERKRRRIEEDIVDEVVDVIMKDGEVAGFKRESGRALLVANLCKDQIEYHLQSLRSSKSIPFPGDVDVIVGGPPCQDMSGANFHSSTKPVLNSDEGNNYQLKVFYNVVEFFKPKFTLMENVPAIFMKEDGMYIKYAIMRLLMMGYQSRLAVLSPSYYGVPQVRWRCFLWGALSGSEQLPAFPQPTFQGNKEVYHLTMLKLAQACAVFPEKKHVEKLHPATLVWDALDDLPQVSNWIIREESQYSGEAMRPYQAFMRRSDPGGSNSFCQKLMQHSTTMNDSHIERIKLLRSRADKKNGLERLGWEVSRRHSNYEQKVVESYLDSLPAEERERTRRWFAAEEYAGHVRMGQEVLSELELAERELQDLTVNEVTDHVPLACGVPYLQTKRGIPKVPMSSFVMLPGVVINDDGSCCVGNFHKIPSDINEGCRGGGTVDLQSKGSVVDNDSWRGAQLRGCKARSYISPTGHLLVPRWCASLANKKPKTSELRRVFGRLHKDGCVGTLTTLGYVVGEQVVIHPEQDRTLTIREFARLQGFPDYYLFLSSEKKFRGTVISRIKQIGNSVSPVVASALGHCLCLAAAGLGDPANDTTFAPNQEMVKAMQEASKECYSQELADDQPSTSSGEISVGAEVQMQESCGPIIQEVSREPADADPSGLDDLNCIKPPDDVIDLTFSPADKKIGSTS